MFPCPHHLLMLQNFLSDPLFSSTLLNLHQPKVALVLCLCWPSCSLKTPLMKCPPSMTPMTENASASTSPWPYSWLFFPSLTLNVHLLYPARGLPLGISHTSMGLSTLREQMACSSPYPARTCAPGSVSFLASVHQKDPNRTHHVSPQMTFSLLFLPQMFLLVYLWRISTILSPLTISFGIVTSLHLLPVSYKRMSLKTVTGQLDFTIFAFPAVTSTVPTLNRSSIHRCWVKRN